MTNYWKIEKKTSEIFSKGAIIHEPLNVENLELILRSGYNCQYDDKEWLEQFNAPFNNVRDHLKKLNDKVRDGHLQTTTSIKDGYGRATYKGFLSLCMLKSEIRQALSINTSTDYDIKNCQPHILYEICKKMIKKDKKEYNELRRYCTKREKWLSTLSKSYFEKDTKENRGKVKVGIIRMCFFGGSISKWFNENNVDMGKNVDVYKLKKEVEAIVDKYIIPNNYKIFEKIKKEKEQEYNIKMKYYKNNKKNNPYLKQPIKKDPKSTLISKFLHEYERKCVEAVLLELMRCGKIKKNEFIYCYDGFQIKNSDVRLEELNTIVKDKVGLEVKFDIKDCADGEKVMEKVNELIKAQAPPANSQDIFDPEYFISIQYKYELQCWYWNKFFCFTQKEGIYWFSDKEIHINPQTGKKTLVNKIQEYSPKHFRESFGHYKTIEVKEDYEKKHCFINKWMDDSDYFRFYKLRNFLPENKPFKLLNDDKLNVYNTFQGYPDFLFSDTPNILKNMINYENNIKYLKYFITNLVGNSEACEQLMYLIGYKIKYPGRKLPYGIIIKGLQGEGKNFLLYLISKIIGEDHYLTTSNIDDIAGTHATGIEGKLIVNLNEMDLKSTQDKTNLMKSLISENVININKKFINHYKSYNFALFIVTSNESLPIVIDMMTGDRRWFIFEGNGENTKLDDETWNYLWAKCEDLNFLRCIYKYFMDLDYNSYSFKKAKRQNSLSKAYAKMASYFIPYELLFLKDFFISNNFLRYTHDEDCDSELYYYEHDAFYQKIEMEAKDMCHEFWEWSTENRVALGQSKNTKAFKNKLMSYNFREFTSCLDSRSRRVKFVFFPYLVMKDVISKKGYDSLDMEKWKKTDLETEKTESNINAIMEFCKKKPNIGKEYQAELPKIEPNVVKNELKPTSEKTVKCKVKSTSKKIVESQVKSTSKNIVDSQFKSTTKTNVNSKVKFTNVEHCSTCEKPFGECELEYQGCEKFYNKQQQILKR